MSDRQTCERCDGTGVDPIRMHENYADGSPYPGPYERPCSTCEGEGTIRTAYAEYLICQRRGHQPSGYQTASIPPQSVCKWCGTYYWYEPQKLVEGMGKPTPPVEAQA